MQKEKFDLAERKYDKIVSLLKGIKVHLEEQEILRKEILDFNEACRYLNVSDSFLYKKTSVGEIPFSKPTGGKLYFERKKLDEYMLSGEVKSDKEMKHQVQSIIDGLATPK